MATKQNTGYGSYRKFRSSIDGHIDKKLPEVISKFCEEGIITEEQRVSAQKKERNARIQMIKKIMREKIQDSEDNFAAILRAFHSIDGIDVRNITADFEKQRVGIQQARHSTPPPKQVEQSSERDSISTHASPSFPQPDQVISSENQSKSNSLSHRRLLGAHVSSLPAIPGSPFNRHMSNEHMGSVVLDSANYTVALQPEEEIAQLANEDLETSVKAQETNITHTHYPRTGHPASMTDQPDLKDEQKCIEELVEAVKNAIESFSANTESSNTDFVMTNMLGLNDKCKHLNERYQKQYELSSKKFRELENNLQLERRRSQELEGSLNIQSTQASKQIQQLENSLQEKELQQEFEEMQRDALVEQLKVKEARVRDLREQLEEATADCKRTRKKLRNILLAEQKGVENKLQIMNDIHQLLGKLNKETSGMQEREVLSNIRAQLGRLRNRPATTGGERGLKQ